MQKRIPWTEKDLDKLRSEYADRRTADIALEIGRPVQSVYAMAYKLGLKKSQEFLSSDASGRNHLAKVGAKTRFQKGVRTWNTGRLGLCIGGRETQFKPGSTPHNVLPVGTVILASIGFLKVKTAEPNQWQWVHKKNWQEVNGPIPKGMVLCFKDGNRENCAVDNLELLPRAEVMKRNSVHNLPPEITQLVLLRGAIVRKINKRKTS